MALTDADLKRYSQDWTAFRREQWVLSNGERFGNVVEPFQLEMLAEWDKRWHDGSPYYQVVMVQAPRGCGKTELAAAEAVTRALLIEGAQVPLLAVDRDQASILHERAANVVKGMDPDLQAAFKVTANKLEVPARGSKVWVMSSDDYSAYGLGGGKAFLPVCDELWAWRGSGLWEAIFTASGKTPFWQILVLSNAGYDDPESTYTQVRNMCLEPLNPRMLLRELPGLEVRRPAWVSEEWVDTMRRTLPELVFQRLICNRVTPLSAVQFLTREEVEACMDGSLEERWSAERNAWRYYVSVDAGVVRDRAAVAVVHKDYERGKIVVENVAVWYPPVRLAQVEEHVMDMCSGRLGSVCLILDPWQMKSFAQRAKEAGVDIVEFVFAPASITKMTVNLLRLFKEREIALYRHQRLLDELVSVRLEERAHGGVRIDHARGQNDDMTVALAMAALEAVQEPTPMLEIEYPTEPVDSLMREWWNLPDLELGDPFDL